MSGVRPRMLTSRRRPRRTSGAPLPARGAAHVHASDGGRVGQGCGGGRGLGAGAEGAAGAELAHGAPMRARGSRDMSTEMRACGGWRERA
eukprot:2727701-Prymnesium_polylepis.1